MAAYRRSPRPHRAAAIGLLLIVLAEGLAYGQNEPSLLAPPPRAAASERLSQEPRRLPADSRPQLLTPIVSPLPSAPPAAQTAPSRDNDIAPASASGGHGGLRVSKGTGVLPNEHGQVWREYDIAPYTLQQQGQAKPEQAVIDWILRETGTELWFGEPLSILSAGSSTLRVYHTPQMHDRVRGIVERLVAGEVSQAVGVRLMTVGSPNWRTKAVGLLKPVDVQSPGVEAWLLSRENAALLLSQLKARSDMREQGAPVEIASGQSQTLTRTQPRQYTKSVQLKREYPFYDLVLGKIDEGYSLEISPLAALDGQTMEAALACRIDQVEKLVPLAIDVPIGAAQSQRVQIQVPQIASWRLSERFRWPAGEVLLVSCGVVANPAPTGGALGLLTPLGVGGGSRADALLLIDCRERQK
jgi:hypothetical protein